MSQWRLSHIVLIFELIKCSTPQHSNKYWVSILKALKKTPSIVVMEFWSVAFCRGIQICAELLGSSTSHLWHNYYGIRKLTTRVAREETYLNLHVGSSLKLVLLFPLIHLYIAKRSQTVPTFHHQFQLIMFLIIIDFHNFWVKTSMIILITCTVLYCNYIYILLYLLRPKNRMVIMKLSMVLSMTVRIVFILSNETGFLFCLKKLILPMS